MSRFAVTPSWLWKDRPARRHRPAPAARLQTAARLRVEAAERWAHRPEAEAAAPALIKLSQNDSPGARAAACRARPHRRR